MALKNKKYPELKLINHSDRGFQYCNPVYIQALNNVNIEISMTQKYDPYENAVSERVNGFLKTEYKIGDGFVDYKDAKREIKHVIRLYNTNRPHLSCEMLVPTHAYKTDNHELNRWTTRKKLYF